MPINLSLSEDERSPSGTSAEVPSPQLNESAFAGAQTTGGSPMEEADMLYEYFPLSVDNWYDLLFWSICFSPFKVGGAQGLKLTTECL